MLRNLFEEIDLKQIVNDYQKLEIKNIRKIGRILAGLVIFIIPVFTYLDIIILKSDVKIILIFRGLFFITAIVFLVLSLIQKIKTTTILKHLYTWLVISSMVMMYGLMLFEEDYYWGNGSLMIIIFLSFIFSIGDFKVLFLTYVPTTILYVVLKFIIGPIMDLGFSNPLLGIVVLLVFSYTQRNNKFNEYRANRELTYEQNKTNELVELILPKKIIEEIHKTGGSEPKLYKDATIVFTDFVNFTSISEKMTPGQLITELDEIFSNFDNIIERHSLHKIKTIGDAYMFAGGIPEVDENHHINVMNASLEIMAYMRRYITDKNAKNEAFWDIRIGINTGKVVAGIIGEKFFSYDTWGDTVNIASRMESASEKGQINISESTYNIIKSSFNCTYRGRIPIKGKGEVGMYFVTK